jgi:peptidoglycan/LPS O-acetylase OafA/YrhL
MQSQNIPALTGLRFFAAMAIVLWHSQTGYFFNYGAFEPFYLAGAVPVFFVLSGFVLTLGTDRYRSWSDFFIARVARVWPAHIAALAFLFWAFYPYSLDFFHHVETVRRLILNALLLQAWSPDMATYWSYNAPSWSVSCELFFYAAFPLAFAVLSRKTLLRIIAIVAVIFGAIVAIDTAHPGIDINWLAGVNPVSCFAAFAIGIAAAVLFKQMPAPQSGGTVIQAAGLTLALAANAFFASHPIPATPAAASFIVTFGPAPFYAALILILARYNGVVSRTLSYGPIVYGGEISYSIYLFHQIIIRWHSGELAALASVPIWLQYAGVIGATFVVAALAHHLIERPFRRCIIAVWRLRKFPYDDQARATIATRR